MQHIEKQPHLHLTKEHMCPVVLTMGDPARVPQIAELCTHSEQLAYNREYRSVRCTYNGHSFLAVSHGIGSAGADICFEELIQLGAKVIIRVGTAGSLQPDTYKQGDVVVCWSAVREDGPTALHVPPGYPAATDVDTFFKILDTAKDLNESVKVGMTLSSDLFYKPKCLPSTLRTYTRAKVDVIEMEIATLFVVCRIEGVKAAALVVCDGCPLSWDQGDYDPSGEKTRVGKESMLRIAVMTAAKLSEEYADI